MAALPTSRTRPVTTSSRQRSPVRSGHDQYWSEPAVQELMRALAALGNTAQALLEYLTLRTLLDEELGIEPSPAIQEVFMSILRAAPEKGSDDVGVLLGLLKRAQGVGPSTVVGADVERRAPVDVSEI